MFERTKEFCDLFLKLGTPGFELAVRQNGEEVLRYRNGFSDRENEIPMNGKERYNIYSCSKVITCTAALMLWEKGLYSLEDRLSDYMPEFTEMMVQTDSGLRKAENPIRIHHLFEMTAGFSYQLSSPSLKQAKLDTNGRCPTRKTMEYLAKEPLLFEPGERWEYSLCHDVLAALVEVLSGEKFEDFVQKNIFVPLGMADTTFMMPEKDLPLLAPQYLRAEGRTLRVSPKNVYRIGSEYASGGAGAVSTVDDYMKFLEGLRTGRLLQEETLRLMQTDRLSRDQKKTFWMRDTHGYGLGVRCPRDRLKAYYTDFGWGGAAGAYLSIDLTNGISLYFARHILGEYGKELRTLLPRCIRAELVDKGEWESVYRELKERCERFGYSEILRS